jgi:iron complex outermembrane receptor protein
MSFSRCFDTLSALKWMTAAVRAITALGNPRIPAREHRPMLPLAALLMAAVLVPAPGRSQEPSAPTAESNEAPKPDAEPSAPSPAEASPPAEQAPAAVGVPEVVVSAPRPKRATTAPPAPTTPSPRRVVADVSRPASPTPAAAPAAAQPAEPAASQGPAGSEGGPGALPKPPGQTITTVSGEQIKDSPAFSVEDLLQESPGVSFKQGNGPRDIGISIRGSNARNGFGVRNIVVLEDGFSVTQPDGLSRTDLIDPHAYGAVDVYRGPSSAMFGNYATGGAINFRLWRGDQINGARYGFESGSFGYVNNYALIGGRNAQSEGTIFMSDVRGDGYISHSGFNTQTLNALGTYSITPDDRVTFKAIDNKLTANLSTRLSLNQFVANPFQRGCTNANAVSAALGCATVNLLANGFGGATIPQTADEAAFGRHDWRNIGGIRWEHDFDGQTTWRTQAVFDDKNINQPTGATSAIGDSPSYNLLTNVTQRGNFFGFDAVHFMEVFYARERLTNYTWNVTPGGGLGSLSSFYDGGHHVNWGGRFREEIGLAPNWMGYVAAGIESTTIAAVNTVFSFPGGAAVPAPFSVQRDFLNYAPEAGLLYWLNEAWQFRGRASTGYGTPTISNLTVTAAGVSGNNSQLASQTNVGLDVGADFTPNQTVKLSVTGFYEFFRNELVNQSPGAGLQIFTFNVPRSVHRGFELAADWRPVPGWRWITAYTWLDQFYVDYTEQLSAGTLTARFDRAGNKIPGVAPNILFTRLGYDEPLGPWKGLGAYVEYVWLDAFYVDNANLLKAPGYGLVNLNLHYDTEVAHSYLKGAIFFFEVQNLLNKTYVASANNVTDSISSVTGLQNPASVLATTGTGSIYAGAPRTFVAGMKLAFR